MEKNAIDDGKSIQPPKLLKHAHPILPPYTFLPSSSLHPSSCIPTSFPILFTHNPREEKSRTECIKTKQKPKRSKIRTACYCPVYPNPQFPLKSMKEREYLPSVSSMKPVNALFSFFTPVKGLLRGYAFRDTDNK